MTRPARHRRRSRGCRPCWRRSSRPPQAHPQVDRSPALAGALADAARKTRWWRACIVNRIWQFHFGRGTRRLVQRSGRDGRRAHSSRAARLAGRRVRWPRAGGSSRCTGMIVLSQTYQRSSAFQPTPPRSTRTTLLLWRCRQRRLEAEVVRDSILAVSGQLNAQMAGPGFYPTLPAAVLEGQSRPGEGWGKSDEREQARAQHLHLRQAQPGSSRDRAARRARHHEQLRAADRLDHRAAGAGIPERGLHPRASAALRSRGWSPKPASRLKTRSTAHLRWPWAGLRGRRVTGRPLNSSRSKSGRSQAEWPVRNARAATPGEGARGVLPGRLEYERVRLQQLTGDPERTFAEGIDA